MTTTTTAIADTILAQLGGQRFIVMTGARSFVGTSRGLRFRIGRNRSRANVVSIELNDLDLYDVEFLSVRGTKVSTKHAVARITAEQLGAAFTSATGLDTRL